jgi:hypothetical protein
VRNRGRQCRIPLKMDKTGHSVSVGQTLIEPKSLFLSSETEGLIHNVSIFYL